MDIEKLTGRKLLVYLRNILSSIAAIYGLSIIDTLLGPMFRVIHLAYFDIGGFGASRLDKEGL